MRHSLACVIACIVLCTSSATYGQNAGQVPKEIQEKLDFFNGQWTGKWTYTTGEVLDEQFARKPILGGRFALITGSAGDREFVIVSGWDAAMKTLTDYAVLSDGLQVTERWKIKDDGDWFRLESSTEGVTGDGKTYTSQNTVRIENGDQYVYEAKNVKLDGEPQPGFKAVLNRKVARPQQTATKEQLIELGEKLVGKWVSEFETEVAAEGVCEVGDKIDQFTSFEMVSNSTAILEKRVYKIDGKTIAEGVALIAWDAPRKQIKSAYFDSLGGSWQSVWRKRGKSFVVQDKGVFGDGRMSTGRNVIEFSDDGNTLTFNHSAQVLGEQTFPDKKSMHRRVQK